MGGRWTFKYKRDETGALSKVSHRSRYVAKGFTQIKNVHYFESFAPVASFVTLRLVFALTALPNFHVNHYDVSVAFIESELDESTPPVCCECAEGYEDPREYAYLLHKSLYGMIQSPRAWYQLWCTICTSFGLQKLVTDGCVHVKYVNNKKTKQQKPKINLNDLKSKRSGQTSHASARPRSHLSRLPSRYRDPHRGHLRRRQSRFFKLRHHASSVCSPLQQTRSFQRRRTCPLVPRHTV